VLGACKGEEEMERSIVEKRGRGTCMVEKRGRCEKNK
jgi:hypothetical protein